MVLRIELPPVYEFSSLAAAGHAFASDHLQLRIAKVMQTGFTNDILDSSKLNPTSALGLAQ